MSRATPMGGDPASMSVGLVCYCCGKKQTLENVHEVCSKGLRRISGLKHVWVRMEDHPQL